MAREPHRELRKCLIKDRHKGHLFSREAKSYILFLNLIEKKGGYRFWHGWKYYYSPEIAILAFGDLIREWPFDSVYLGRIAKVVGDGGVSFYCHEQ